jgi:hypothetical protein
MEQSLVSYHVALQANKRKLKPFRNFATYSSATSQFISKKSILRIFNSGHNNGMLSGPNTKRLKLKFLDAPCS